MTEPGQKDSPDQDRPHGADLGDARDLLGQVGPEAGVAVAHIQVRRAGQRGGRGPEGGIQAPVERVCRRPRRHSERDAGHHEGRARPVASRMTEAERAGKRDHAGLPDLRGYPRRR